jgi:hypothetical protein
MEKFYSNRRYPHSHQLAVHFCLEEVEEKKDYSLEGLEEGMSVMGLVADLRIMVVVLVASMEVV